MPNPNGHTNPPTSSRFPGDPSRVGLDQGMISLQRGLERLEMLAEAIITSEPRRVSQEGQPIPATGEYMIWHQPSTNRVWSVYQDPVAGTVLTEMNP